MNTQSRGAAVLAGALLLAACEVPTEAPILEQRWVVPVEETTLGVDELLPAGVTVSGGNFSVSVDPFTTSESLGTMCGGCSGLNGLTVPAPAFSASFDVSENLPANVTAASISSGSIGIVIQNGFSFDPVAGGGSLTVTLFAGQGGAQLGQVVFTGSLPANSSASQTLTLASSSIGSSFYATVDVSSPGGQVGTIDTSDEISVTATTNSLLVSSATVNVSNQSVDLDPVDLDVEGMDSSVTDRIQQGTIILDIANPFGVSVSGTINIGPTSKSFSISGSATSQVSITYTGEELRSFLGQPNVQFSGSGTASGGSITVTPGQQMTVEATLDITIQVG